MLAYAVAELSRSTPEAKTAGRKPKRELGEQMHQWTLIRLAGARGAEPTLPRTRTPQ